jgi:Rieske Fe-S protein
LRDVPAGGRTVIDYGDAKVEVRRTGAGIEARLLLCTHFGCPVTWDEVRASYVCPCHGGQFSAEGEAVAGPPSGPLLRVPVFLSADAVTVGMSPPGPS